MSKMKKLTAMALSVLMLSAMSTSVFAAEPTSNLAGKTAVITFATPRSPSTTITENYVRLRSGPGLSYTAIRQLQKGDMVVILYGDWVDADGYTWVPVQISGEKTNGWVASIYIGEY